MEHPVVKTHSVHFEVSGPKGHQSFKIQPLTRFKEVIESAFSSSTKNSFVECLIRRFYRIRQRRSHIHIPRTHLQTEILAAGLEVYDSNQGFDLQRENAKYVPDFPSRFLGPFVRNS